RVVSGGGGSGRGDTEGRPGAGGLARAEPLSRRDGPLRSRHRLGRLALEVHGAQPRLLGETADMDDRLTRPARFRAGPNRLGAESADGTGIGHLGPRRPTNAARAPNDPHSPYRRTACAGKSRMRPPTMRGSRMGYAV